MSLVRYQNREHSSDGRRLFWHRSDIDGFPFRGDAAPLLTDEEMDQKVVKVADYRNAFFNVKNAQQNKQFCDVMECCVQGWFRLMFIDRFWQGTTEHYVEWAEYYGEDGSRSKYVSGSLEMMNGQQNGFGAY